MRESESESARLETGASESLERERERGRETERDEDRRVIDGPRGPPKPLPPPRGLGPSADLRWRH